LNARPQLSTRWVYTALITYTLGIALFWPRVLLIVDEERYVSQAVEFARGSPVMVSDYPPATSLLQAPFVRVLGWRGAVLVSLLALIGATLLTMRWLKDSGKPPAFALLVPGFLGTAFFGRIAMSDAPSTALVALTCYLLWRADGGVERRLYSLAAGFCAGISVLFREPLVVLLAPLLAGAAVRHRAHAPVLLMGLAGGFLLRPLLMQLLFDSPAYVRDPGFGFSFGSLVHTGPLLAFILLVLFPAGAMLPIVYRASRRAELVAATGLYIALFLLFDYDAVRDNGLMKGVMLEARYIAPLTPVLAFMAADVWPRWVDGFGSWAVVGATTMAMGVVGLAFAVHPLAASQERVPLSIVRAMYAHTDLDSPVVTNTEATLKYFSGVYGRRRIIPRYALNADSIQSLRGHHNQVTLALLDRRDSEKFRLESQENARFVRDVGRRCALVERLDTAVAAWAHLRILAVSSCR
jgi:hypothetical protein